MRKPAAIFLAALLLLCIDAFAIRVRHSELTAIQPDGSAISLIASGDEHFHYLTTTDGKLVKRGPDGAFYYAYFDSEGILRPTSFLAGKPAPASVLSEAGRFPEALISARIAAKKSGPPVPEGPNLMKRFLSAHPFEASSGAAVKHGLIILAEFSDVSHVYSKSLFENIIKGGGDDTAIAYFNDQFSGRINFEFDIVDWVPLPQTQAFYGANVNNTEGNDVNPEQMVVDACTLADPYVDFSKYDDDGDGKVDNVFIWFSGNDEADDPANNADCVWSHAYRLSYAGKSLTLDGVTIDSYACTSELLRKGYNNYVMASIGTFCHEYSHTFGLPDLYDTDYGGSGGTGKGLWRSLGLMDAGNQNNNGYTPPYYNAIDRHELGLSEGIPLTVGAHTLEPIHLSGKYYIMETNNPGEYYLFECRSSQKWDAYCGGTGLLIYHIDQSQNLVLNKTAELRWRANTLNCVPSHQCADVVPANPNASVVSQVFWPNGTYKSYTPQGDPAFVYWDGTDSFLALVDIRKNGDSVSFTVTDEFAPVPSVTSASASVFQDAAIISITSSSSTYTGDVVVEWYKSGTTNVQRVEVSPAETGTYHVLIEGLTPKTAYKTRIFFENGGVSGNIYENLSFTTKTYRDGSMPFIYFNGVERDEQGRFASGGEIPLRVYNVPNAAEVLWSFDGRSIAPASNCLYKLTRSGLLKAEITLQDGSKEIIVKQINVK
ncbi:MAG: M6 family metalloprotease domain-containing protein [Bacteroidales bacterium]|nr:M6 family metalloprotease domain-containing protein [Bacteroidales bacterium]